MDEIRESRYLPKSPKEWSAVAAACVGLIWLFGDDLWMHMQRMRSRVRDAVRENVPLEVEVERARSAAASMIPEIRQNQEIIVREKVEIDELRGEVKREQRELVRQRNEILALRARVTVTDTGAAARTPPATPSLSAPRAHR